MRKSEDGGPAPYSRLSSSCSSIRSSNYSVPPSYGPSLSTYKYSPSAYTSNRLPSASSSSSHRTDSILSPSRTPRHSYGGSSTLGRTPSTSHKTLYTSPAAARVSISVNDSLSTGPINNYRGISRYSSSSTERSIDPKPYTSSASSSSYERKSRVERVPEKKIELGPTTRSNMVHPTSSHIRSRSSSYRSVNVSQFAQQGRERAEKEAKDRDYKEWMEKEKEKRENDFDTTSLSSSFTQPSTTTTSSSPSTNTTTPSANQSDFRKSISSSFRSSGRYSSGASSSSTVSTSRAASQINDLVASSYSSTSSVPPPEYTQLSTPVSTMLRNRRTQLDAIDKETTPVSRRTSPSPGPGPAPPPPPPPPPSQALMIPRSVSTSVISPSSSYKPTAKVSPYDDQNKGCIVSQGYTGLRNIGNTCFMNAVLQMLINNIELREFFLNSHYSTEINEDNPLGSQGRLANAFADFMKQVWSGMHKAIEPIRIKEIVAEKANQFANFAQHDAHEFLSFLLDGLHEDVNRVKKKPTTTTVESDGRHDMDVSNEAWRNHTLRNDSIFTDLFHGQLKSHVQCPNCDKVSITFDPFAYLPVPFPKRKRSSNVVFWPLDTQSKPINVTVSYSPEGTVADVLTAVSESVRVPARNLKAIEAFGHRIDKILTNDMKAIDIGTSDVIYVFQIHDETDCNEEIVTLYVLQRQMYATNLRYMCNHCGANNTKLKACDACYNAYYCNKDCQQENWINGGHRDECRRRPTSEVVGQPLVLSFPKSQLNYQQLYRVMEAKSRHSITIFQTPQYNAEDGKPESDTMQVPNASLKKRNGVGAPPSFMSSPDKLTNGTIPPTASLATSRRQSVLGEPRFKTQQRMFEIRKLAFSTEAFGEAITEETDLADKLTTESYLTINWINLRFGKEYITVANRTELDVDEDKSRLMCSKSSSSLERANNCETNPQLSQMLDLFSETERLKPEESWYCSKCKLHVEATKQLQLYRLPPILIIQLKRFVYTAFTHQTSLHRRSKDERAVEYPLENLDMAPFLAQTAPHNKSTIYDLTGVVCHSGSSYFGHYISIGRLADYDSSKTKIEWRQFDDSMVTKQNVSNVQTSDAYLLFYKLRDPSVTRGIFKRHYSCDPGEMSTETTDK